MKIKKIIRGIAWIPKLSYLLAKDLTVNKWGYIREVDFLKQRFSDKKGIDTLLEMYKCAQGSELQEPSGKIDRKTGNFKLAELEPEKEQYYMALHTRDMDKIKELRDNVAEEREKGNLQGEEFLDGMIKSLDECIEDSRDSSKVANAVLNYSIYASSYAVLDTKAKKKSQIDIHMHPTDKIYKKKEHTGYSEADEKIAYRIPLGLVEYHHKANLQDGVPVVDVDFSVRHRFCWWENKVGQYKFTVSPEMLKVSDGNRMNVTHQLSPIRLSRTNAVRFLARSPYLLPFIRFDPNEPVDFFSKLISIKSDIPKERKKELEIKLNELDVEYDEIIVKSARDSVEMAWGPEIHNYIAQFNKQ